MQVGKSDQDEYFTLHAAAIEAALSRAVSDALEQQVDDPLIFIAQQLLQNAGVTPPGGSSGSATSSGKWTACGWMASLGIASPVARALFDGRDDDLQAMRALASTMGSVKAVAERLQAGHVVEKLAAQLHPALAELSSAEAAGGGDLQSKFAGAIEMSYSGLDTFYGGLEGRIGEPQAAVFETMRAEHHKRTDSMAEFTTGNYGVTTTSSTEWIFVVEPFSDSGTRLIGREGWAVESIEKMADQSHCRKPEALEDVLRRGMPKNAALAKQGEPEVIMEEVVAARLYTGPVLSSTRPRPTRHLLPHTQGARIHTTRAVLTRPSHAWRCVGRARVAARTDVCQVQCGAARPEDDVAFPSELVGAIVLCARRGAKLHGGCEDA